MRKFRLHGIKFVSRKHVMREFRLHSTEFVCRKHVMREFRLHGTGCFLQQAFDAGI